MREEFPSPARSMGIAAAGTILAAATAYGVTLLLALAALASPAQPIGDPYFAIMEVLILVMAPAMVALMAAVHAWAAPPFRALSLVALCLMVMLATVTCCVHFTLLTLDRHPMSANQPAIDFFLAFKWPSVVYALDILGWDYFFALSMLFAAPVFQGAGLCRAIRNSMIASAVLALAGLGGVLWDDMQLRNIGIAGYLGLFLVSDALLLALFLRSSAAEVKSPNALERN